MREERTYPQTIAILSQFAGPRELLLRYLPFHLFCRCNGLCRTELQSTFTKAGENGGMSSEDGLTRSQALERVGVDLGRVGVMTSSCTASQHSLLTDGGNGCGQDTERGGVGGRVATATNSYTDAGGTARGKAEPRANITGIMRDRGGNSGMTVVTKGNAKISSKSMAVRRQQLIMSEKLKVLNNLLSDGLLCQLPAEAEEDREKTTRTTKSRMQLMEHDSIIGSERNGIEDKAAAGVFVDLGTGGDDKGVESCVDIVSAEGAPSRKTLARGCEDSQAPAEPKKATTAVADIRAQDGVERGGATEACLSALQESAPTKKVMDVERHHLYKEALPTHR